MDVPEIPNVLAQRYASAPLVELWSPRHKVVLERRFWLAVLRAQRDAGVDVPDGVIEDYEAVVDQVDLASIDARERVTRHDVKARIEEFCALAGHEHIHKGLTSRDLTENVEQMQIRASLELVRDRMVATLVRLAAHAVEYGELVMVGRSHNVAAQATTLGKRFASAAEELLVAFDRVEDLLRPLSAAGHQGSGRAPSRTSSTWSATRTRWRPSRRPWPSTSAPRRCSRAWARCTRARSTSMWSRPSCRRRPGPTSFATTIRLMAGQELVTEGFRPGQVGSSAMPHKMNTRSCERVCGLSAILAGHLTMVTALSGDQWNEGDVSCSVVRRVALPDAFFAIDGLFQTFLTVLDEFGAYPAVIEAELRRYLPFLATTRMLVRAVQAGMGREVAHEVIKEHAVAVALSMRETGQGENDLLARLAADDRFVLDAAALDELLAEPLEFVGAAPQQVALVAKRVSEVANRYPDAAAYQPEPVL